VKQTASVLVGVHRHIYLHTCCLIHTRASPCQSMLKLCPNMYACHHNIFAIMHIGTLLRAGGKLQMDMSATT